MRAGVIFVVLFFAVLPGFVNATIISVNELTIDFADPNDARSKATWFEPHHYTITKRGLGWDGPKTASRNFWLKSTELAIGLSWRPAQSVHVSVELEPAPGDIMLDNGNRIRRLGAVFVRHSPDGTHWSSWQSLDVTPASGTAASDSPARWGGYIRIPRLDRVEYEKYMRQYQELDVPWQSDEEALVEWIIRREPNFFEKPLPFIGYVQFLYELSLPGGRRIKNFHVTASCVVGGTYSDPKDPNATRDMNSMPWRYRSYDGLTARIDLAGSDLRFKKDFSVPIIIENRTGRSVQIDTSADEVIEPPSEKSGGSYKERGSRCEISVTQDQDHDSRFDFFSTADIKIESPDKASDSFTIEPGMVGTLKFSISPWGPTRGSFSSTATPGPAQISGRLSILINGQRLTVPLEPVKINFVE